MLYTVYIVLFKLFNFIRKSSVLAADTESFVTVATMEVLHAALSNY